MQHMYVGEGVASSVCMSDGASGGWRLYGSEGRRHCRFVVRGRSDRPPLAIRLAGPDDKKFYCQVFLQSNRIWSFVDSIHTLAERIRGSMFVV